MGSIHTFVCSLSMNTITERTYADESWKNANQIKIELYITCLESEAGSIHSFTKVVVNTDSFRNENKSIFL